MNELIVLGLGNVLCGDDGVGVEVIWRLRRDFELPPEVRLLDGGTLGLALMSEIAGAPAVLLVDAIRDEGEPGTLVRLDGDEVAPAARHRLSVHQIGVTDLLDSLRLIDAYPASMTLLGVVPAGIDLGIGFSRAVEAALPQLVEEVAAEIAARGFAVARRTGEGELPASPLPWAVLAVSANSASLAESNESAISDRSVGSVGSVGSVRFPTATTKGTP